MEIIAGCAQQTEAKPKPLDLERGFATIPLKGIDVPFHSTFLRSGVKPFRSFLLKKINKTTIDPSKLIGKYIPNVTAKPFELTKEYFEDVYRLTNSPKIKEVLANWESYQGEGTGPALSDSSYEHVNAPEQEEVSKTEESKTDDDDEDDEEESGDESESGSIE